MVLAAVRDNRCVHFGQDNELPITNYHEKTTYYRNRTFAQHDMKERAEFYKLHVGSDYDGLCISEVSPELKRT
jgi:hypothetical protein